VTPIGHACDALPRDVHQIQIQISTSVLHSVLARQPLKMPQQISHLFAATAPTSSTAQPSRCRCDKNPTNPKLLHMEQSPSYQTPPSGGGVGGVRGGGGVTYQISQRFFARGVVIPHRFGASPPGGWGVGTGLSAKEIPWLPWGATASPSLSVPPSGGDRRRRCPWLVCCHHSGEGVRPGGGSSWWSGIGAGGGGSCAFIMLGRMGRTVAGRRSKAGRSGGCRRVPGRGRPANLRSNSASSLMADAMLRRSAVLGRLRWTLSWRQAKRSRVRVRVSSRSSAAKSVERAAAE
jgi:hypothetical protein